MFIKNQEFSDEDALLEAIFDFSLGEASASILQLQSVIQSELKGNKDFQEYRATLDEESREALDDEEMEIRLAEKLMAKFHNFKIYKQQLFGIKDDQETLLYSIDLV